VEDTMLISRRTIMKDVGRVIAERRVTASGDVVLRLDTGVELPLAGSNADNAAPITFVRDDRYGLHDVMRAYDGHLVYAAVLPDGRKVWVRKDDSNREVINMAYERLT
jgi:hypothetical protein